ncbi:MAG: hypothetical protein ACI8QF_001997, partial [Limisphaerales bacterium]
MISSQELAISLKPPKVEILDSQSLSHVQGESCTEPAP